MKILIVTAMPEEMAPFEKLLAPVGNYASSRNFPLLKKAGGANLDVYLAVTGIGKVNAAASVQAAICELGPDLVINCGTAGGLGSYQIFTPVLANGFVQADVNLTAFGYLPGQLPGEPSNIYECANQMRGKFKDYLISHDKDFAEGLVATGDFFLNSKEDIEKIQSKFGKVAFDMESGAIAHVCRKNGVPLISLKCISDNGDDESSGDFEACLAKAAAIPAEYICGFLKV